MKIPVSNGSLVIQLNRFWEMKDIARKALLYSRKVKEAGIYQTHKGFNTMFLVMGVTFLKVM